MLFTGDLVSHDSENQLSRDYVEYAEVVLYDLFKRTLLSGPVYATLGNHDSYHQAQGSPNSLDAPGPNQFSWNYDHVSALWEHEGWLSGSIIESAKTHYAAYSVQRSDGLRVISLNTNLWYKANWFNYINMTDPDVSGMLRMLTDELQEAEDAGERAWIIGHVLSGWDGTNPLQNPTNLFYQIVDRFSPHVIASIFWGHTHGQWLSTRYDICTDPCL
jgi:sphingomyelin phosphodiesterase